MKFNSLVKTSYKAKKKYVVLTRIAQARYAFLEIQIYIFFSFLHLLIFNSESESPLHYLLTYDSVSLGGRVVGMVAIPAFYGDDK